MDNDQKKIEVKAKDETLQGCYANTTQITHGPEEFVLDFLNILPPMGTLNARVIVSPGHLKRMIAALQDNLRKYEDKYGEVTATRGPSTEDFYSGKK